MYMYKGKKVDLHDLVTTVVYDAANSKSTNVVSSWLVCRRINTHWIAVKQFPSYSTALDFAAWMSKNGAFQYGVQRVDIKASYVELMDGYRLELPF